MKANLSQNVTTLVDEVPLPQNISEQVHYTTLKPSHNHFWGELVIDDSLRLIMERSFPFRQ